MVRRSRKGNPQAVRLVADLEKAARLHRAPVWSAVADRLSRARHAVRPLNVGHLNRLAAANETVVVAGKLLAAGELTKRLTVGAFSYSKQAREKIHAAGGSALSLHDLVKAHPEGKEVRLLA